MNGIAWMASQPNIEPWTARRVIIGDVSSASVERVMATLARKGAPMTNAEIAASLGISRDRARAITRAAYRSGLIEVLRGRPLGKPLLGSSPDRYTMPGRKVNP